MRLITLFEAMDGTRFNNSNDCIEYEKDHGFYQNRENFHLFNSTDEDITADCIDDPDLTANAVEWLIIDNDEAVNCLKALFRAGDSSTLDIDSSGTYYWDYYDCKWRKENN